MRRETQSVTDATFRVESILLDRIEDAYNFYQQRLADYPENVLKAYIKGLSDFFKSDISESVHKQTTEIFALPPVTVVRISEDRYVLIDGVLRVLSAKEAGATAIRAVVYDAEDIDDLDTFVIAERARKNAGQGLALLEHSQRDIARKLYVSGWGLKDIASVLGVSIRTVYRYTEDLREPKRKLDEEQIKEAVERIREGEAVRKVAKDLGVSHTALLKRVKAFDANESLSTNALSLSTAPNTPSLSPSAIETCSQSLNDLGPDFENGEGDLEAEFDKVCVSFSNFDEFKQSIETLLNMLPARIKDFVNEGAKEEEVYEVVKKLERTAKELRKNVLGHERKMSDAEVKTLQFVDKHVVNVANKYATTKKYAGLIENYAKKLITNVNENDKFDILLSLLTRYYDVKIESSEQFTFEEVEEWFNERLKKHVLTDRDVQAVFYAEHVLYNRGKVVEGYKQGNEFLYKGLKFSKKDTERFIKDLQIDAIETYLNAPAITYSSLKSLFPKLRFKTEYSAFLAKRLWEEINRILKTDVARLLKLREQDKEIEKRYADLFKLLRFNTELLKGRRITDINHYIDTKLYDDVSELSKKYGLKVNMNNIYDYLYLRGALLKLLFVSSNLLAFYRKRF